MNKKLISLILVITLVLSMGVTASASDSIKKYDYNYYANVLKACGLFYGTDKGFELEREATRAEALVMFLRVLGLDDEALASNLDTSFTDVPDWVRPYVGYAEKNNLTSGLGNGKFGSSKPVSAKDFSTFLLRGLGYSDKDGDFTWNDSVDFFGSLGSVKSEYINYLKNNKFIRGDMALMAHETLLTNVKGEDLFLVEKLGVGTYATIMYMPYWYEPENELAFSIDFLNTGIKNTDNLYVELVGIAEENYSEIGDSILGKITMQKHFELYETEKVKNIFGMAFGGTGNTAPDNATIALVDRNKDIKYMCILDKSVYEKDLAITRPVIVFEPTISSTEEVVDVSKYLKFNDETKVISADLEKIVKENDIDFGYANIDFNIHAGDNWAGVVSDEEYRIASFLEKDKAFNGKNQISRVSKLGKVEVSCETDNPNYCYVTLTIFDSKGFPQAVGYCKII